MKTKMCQNCGEKKAEHNIIFAKDIENLMCKKCFLKLDVDFVHGIKNVDVQEFMKMRRVEKEKGEKIK